MELRSQQNRNQRTTNQRHNRIFLVPESLEFIQCKTNVPIGERNSRIVAFAQRSRHIWRRSWIARPHRRVWVGYWDFDIKRCEVNHPVNFVRECDRRHVFGASLVKRQVDLLRLGVSAYQILKSHQIKQLKGPDSKAQLAHIPEALRNVPRQMRTVNAQRNKKRLVGLLRKFRRILEVG